VSDLSLPYRPVSVRLAPALRCHDACDPQRAEVEAFIRRVYAEHYGARITSFAPTLLSMRDAQGRLRAAAGFRSANDGPLFLERYLSGPVDQLLGSQVVRVDRARIVEVGHLAALQAGDGRRMAARVAAQLVAQGQDWIVCTLTAPLRHLFTRLGIASITLGVADPARLGADAPAWGSYYEQAPLVQAGYLPGALPALHRSEH
jgi:hypothetical protein